MTNVRCAIINCKLTMFNKPLGVTFHPCPTSINMRNKWLMMLKNKCSMLDWGKSRICSKHFENKYFDSQRKLYENAVPTIFQEKLTYSGDIKSKIEKLLSKQSQSELSMDVKRSLAELIEPTNLDSFVDDDLNCASDAPTEAKLWLLIKKQANLISRLTDQRNENKKHVNTIRKNMDTSNSSKMELEHNLETMKYIVKSLQEKHATLEEQIEILTAVESR